MRKGYNILLVAFIATVFASFFSKIGAISLDKILFIFISYTIGSLIALSRYFPNRVKINKKIKARSRNFGIIIGVINFLAFYTLLAALSLGPGSLVYPIVSLDIALIVILSMILFKERLNFRGIIGFVLAMIAIILLR